MPRPLCRGELDSTPYEGDSRWADVDGKMAKNLAGQAPGPLCGQRPAGRSGRAGCRSISRRRLAQTQTCLFLPRQRHLRRAGAARTINLTNDTPGNFCTNKRRYRSELTWHRNDHVNSNSASPHPLRSTPTTIADSPSLRESTRGLRHPLRQADIVDVDLVGAAVAGSLFSIAFPRPYR